MIITAEKSLLNITPAAQQDAALLLTHCLQQPFTYLITHHQDHLTLKQQQHADELLQQALTSKPIAYILGHTEFYGLPFNVNQHTLIPRSATECLVDWILNHFSNKPMAIADCGTGSGAIACVLAHNRPAWQITAIEQCADALQTAQINAEKLHVAKQVTFKQQSWLDAIEPNTFDLIVSNPPYIDLQDDHIDQAVLQHEPAKALFSAEKGLHDIQLLISQTYTCLKPGGLLALEHGHNQQQAVIFIRTRRLSIQGHSDLSVIIVLLVHQPANADDYIALWI